MDHFDHILNWTLKPGSHTFPGQDGGTCINEAAIVAAGFAYQPVKSVDEMPACFSRPICRLAMRLNDEATEEQRQRLLPFVTKAGVCRYRSDRAGASRLHPQGDQWSGQLRGRLAVLAGAVAIGRQADALDAVGCEHSDEHAAQSAEHPTAVPEESLAALFTSWAWVKRKVKVS